MTTTTTITTKGIASIAAAGLGRKVRTMTETICNVISGRATNGEVWIDAGAAVEPGAEQGREGSITPAPECGNEMASVVISGRDLRRIIDGIVPATDTETARYALGGTLVEIAEGSMLTVVGTDGRRLHAGHIQPVTIRGQAAPIVRAEQWKALDASIRSGCKSIAGVTGKRLDAMVDRGTVVLTVYAHETGGAVVWIMWSAETGPDTLVVASTALAVAGRFPRWRDVMPDGGKRLTVDAWDVAEAVAEYKPLHRAAEKAGKAAWKAEQDEKRRRGRDNGGEYRHPVGIDCGPAGMTGYGAEWSSTVPAAPVVVRLDHRYLADALAAADAWGARMVEAIGTDDRSAVTFQTGEHGHRLVAVIMPLY